MTPPCGSAGARRDRVPASLRAGSVSRFLPRAATAPRCPVPDEPRAASPARHRPAPSAGAATAVSVGVGFCWIALRNVRTTTYRRQIAGLCDRNGKTARPCKTGRRFPDGRALIGAPSRQRTYSISSAGRRAPAPTTSTAIATRITSMSSRSCAATPGARSSNTSWPAHGRRGGATTSRHKISERSGASWKSSASALRRWKWNFRSRTNGLDHERAARRTQVGR